MTDYQNALVLDNLDLVNWVIRTRISIPNRPLLTYDDFYAIGCEAICRAALKYNADTGEFAPFACRYIYNAIVDHCRAINFRMERNVEIPENEDTQTPLSVPELVRCFENDVRDVSSADKVISAIYTEESDNQARLNNASGLSDYRQKVLEATANLYLTRQVILEHA